MESDTLSFFDFLAEKLADAMIAAGLFVVDWCRNHKKAAIVIAVIIFILIDIAAFRKYAR